MNNIKASYNHLVNQIEQRLKKLIKWKGIESDHVNTECLKIDMNDCEYTEIAIINERLTLLDSDGMHYNLSVIDFETLCSITDQLSIFNPRTEIKRPLRHLSDSNVDLSQFPNFSATGSPEGMRKRYYGKGALLVQFGKYIYNVTSDPHIYFECAKEENDQDY